MTKPTVVSLFSGIGGIDIAFMQSGFEIMCANELDKDACVTYRNNFSDCNLIEKDIKSILAAEFPQADVITAGFPCQSFSVMGYQRGFNDKRGNLFYEIVRVAQTVQPKIILLENVKNLIYHDDYRTIITIHNELSRLGYTIKYSVLSPNTHANIPQDRKRVFVVAFSDIDMMNSFTFPDEMPLTKGIDDIINRKEKHSDIYYYSTDSRYYNELNRKITDKVGMYRIDDSGVANKRYNISPTLKANMGTYHDRVPVIRDDFGIRRITPLECLAFQGYPTEYVFKGIPLESAYKQAGNTVCVPVVKRIADNIFKALYKGEK